MNGAVYISFFQGQLESVLEQVVQFAVQEISKTVGSSLNALLLETAVKEQENQRLRLQLQSREKKDGSAADDGGSAVKRSEEEAGSDRTKPQQRQQQQRTHAPGGHSTEPRSHTDTRRQEQKGRVVAQLKSVMEKVLNFAVRKLTKIVEASFDDLLLEITKMDCERQTLEERLDRSSDRGGGTEVRRDSENDSVSPSGSDDAREDPPEVTVSKEKAEAEDSQRPPVLSVSQEWFPILDKVFGQKWCSDVLHVKELDGGGQGRERAEPLLEPSPSSPQQDPRWTPLEDMEVFSPDQDDGTDAAGTADAPAAEEQRSAAASGPSPLGPALSPTDEGGANFSHGAENIPGEGSSGRRSSVSMLHRLLTLPSQLLDDDNSEDACAKDALAALTNSSSNDASRDIAEAMGSREGEEEEEEEKGRKKKRRRVWSECDECGRSFSRMSLLKAHRQTHVSQTANTDASSPPSSPPTDATPPLRCSDCGKRFSSATRLHSHVRTQHPTDQL